jgi:uncharacterized protein DUF4406
MKLYLAGPMRGIPFFNFPAFAAAAAFLRERGNFVFSPAERDTARHGGYDITNPDGCELRAAREHGFDIREAMFEDMEFICKHAEGIALLPGWENSLGAQAEVAVAKTIGLHIIKLPGARNV